MRVASHVGVRPGADRRGSARAGLPYGAIRHYEREVDALCPASFDDVAPPKALVDEVRAAHGTAGRAYHDLRHVGEVVAALARARADVGLQRPAEALLAALFHDAVYVPGAKDNEAKSAALAREVVARLDPRALDVAWIEATILATARHGALREGDVDADAAIVLDCDMAILAAPAGRFAEYEAQIAAEYAFVPPEAYAAGRRAFLERVLAGPAIYLSPWGRDAFERAARDNLARALRG